MYNDVESDFWKEIFVHMQHKNMVRIGAERLAVQDCSAAFERFQFAHPDIKVETTSSSSYCTWEMFISETVKLRLFIQTQIKGTLLQKTGGDLVKIADAKFPNNPFPEIEEFLSKRNDYLKELHKKLESSVRLEKAQKLTAEFIKAHLYKKFSNKSEVIWTLEPEKAEFKLTLQQGKETKIINLTSKNFIKEIEAL